ncbi:unnamed protein product [Adineta ricciae]|uniref:Uncharacterized protein n=1 Tax=Adineta ricciae TaxID=249248 RepID=A0A815GHT1_ADIRI|nr:unnamed protein product [Adineta ricciae]
MTKLVYNGYSANPTIETCNSCNCQDDGWIDSRHQIVLDRPMMFTENEGRCHPWGKSVSIRTASDTAYSVAKWFTGGGSSGIATMYADNSQYVNRTVLPYWDGTKWTSGTQQFGLSLKIKRLQCQTNPANYVDVNANNTIIVPTTGNELSMANIVRTKRVKSINDGKYQGEFDDHDEGLGNLESTITFDLSSFKLNQQYLFEILSISLRINSDVTAYNLEYKGIVGNNRDQLLATSKGLNRRRIANFIKKALTWFQARFDLDYLMQQDTNINPILLAAQSLNREHAFINGNDIGIYWLIEAVCRSQPG